MGSQSRRDNTNFKVALGMLEDIQKTGRPGPDLDRESLRLWTCTLAGMGYIRKAAGRYAVTEKGRKVLSQHMAHMAASA